MGMTDNSVLVKNSDDIHKQCLVRSILYRRIRFIVTFIVLAKIYQPALQARYPVRYFTFIVLFNLYRNQYMYNFLHLIDEETYIVSILIIV